VQGQDGVGGHAGIMRDYFNHTILNYDPYTFRRWYQMSRKLFLNIFDGVMTYDDYFSAKLDI
jgi:hypothetical protein